MVIQSRKLYSLIDEIEMIDKYVKRKLIKLQNKYKFKLEYDQWIVY